MCIVPSFGKSNSPSPIQGDVGLRKYSAPAGRETALLLIPPTCERWSLDTGLLQNSQWWQTLKQTALEDGIDELSIVSDILTVTRWVQDYRPPYEDEAIYIVTLDRSHNQDLTLRQQFRFFQNHTSRNVHESNPQDQTPYTVLAKKILVKRRSIGVFGNWVSGVKSYFTIMICRD